MSARETARSVASRSRRMEASRWLVPGPAFPPVLKESRRASRGTGACLAIWPSRHPALPINVGATAINISEPEIRRHQSRLFGAFVFAMRGILIPPFQAALINWIPESLADDLYANGERSWPDVKHLLQIV